MGLLLSSVEPRAPGRWRDGRGYFIRRRKCPWLSLSWPVDDDKRFVDARRASLLLSSIERLQSVLVAFLQPEKQSSTPVLNALCGYPMSQIPESILSSVQLLPLQWVFRIPRVPTPILRSFYGLRDDVSKYPLLSTCRHMVVSCLDRRSCCVLTEVNGSTQTW